MRENEILPKIYPSVVTCGSDWRKMVKDVERFKLSQISLFLTTVGIRERQRIYQALKNTSVKEIPHVHIRHDMVETELDFLASFYSSKVFTIHFQYCKILLVQSIKNRFILKIMMVSIALEI